jgi:hypothetical protein
MDEKYLCLYMVRVCPVQHLIFADGEREHRGAELVCCIDNMFARKNLDFILVETLL